MRVGSVISVEDQGGIIGGTYETVTKMKEKETTVVCIPQISAGAPLHFCDLL